MDKEGHGHPFSLEAADNADFLQHMTMAGMKHRSH